MKVIVETKEGLECLLGKSVLLMCANYFYAGKLIGVNKSCVKLEEIAHPNPASIRSGKEL